MKSENFCNRKVERAITTWGEIKKSPILLSQYSKITIFIEYQELFRILGAQIIFWSIVTLHILQLIP